MRAGRWRARARNGLGLGMLLSCGLPDSESRLKVLALAGNATFSLTETIELESGSLRTLLSTVDLDSDGAEEVLFSDHQGLWWTDGRSPRLLYEWRDVIDAQWVPATSRHEGRLALLTDDDLLLLECASGADPVCTEVSHSQADLDVSAMVVADLDEDEVMDILTLNQERIALMRGAVADGELEWPSREPFDEADTPLQGLAAADLDDDGHVDVVASDPYNADRGEVLVYFGDGAGGWGEMSDSLWASCRVGQPWIVAADGDALPDILIGCSNPTIFRNLGGRQFEAVALRDVEPAIDDVAIVRPGHFGGDGLSVFVGTFSQEGAWSFGIADGSTWTTMPIDVGVDLDDAHLVETMVVDLDGDGIDEVMFRIAEYPGC